MAGDGDQAAAVLPVHRQVEVDGGVAQRPPRPSALAEPLAVAAHQFEVGEGGRKTRGGKKFDELAFYADHFDTVEINSSFYRIPSVETAEAATTITLPDDQA